MSSIYVYFLCTTYVQALEAKKKLDGCGEKNIYVDRMKSLKLSGFVVYSLNYKFLVEGRNIMFRQGEARKQVKKDLKKPFSCR